MPPKKNGPSKPNATRKRKCDEEDDTEKPRAPYKRLLPAPAKPRRNADGTIVQVQQYTPGYGPKSRPQDLAAGPVGAIKRESPDSPSLVPPVSNYKRQRARQARDRITHLRRTAGMRPAVPSLGMMGPQPPSPPPQSRNDGGLGVRTFWYPNFERMFQESVRRAQRQFQSEPPGILNLNLGTTFNGADSSWMTDMAMVNPQIFSNAAPLQYGQTPDTIFSTGHAAAPVPDSYNGVIDPLLLPPADEALQGYNMAMPVHNVQQFGNTGENGVNFDFDNLLSQQQPQPPSQAQDTYLLQEGSFPQQPPTYAQLQPPAYANGYPPQQQQSWFLANYAYNPPQQQALTWYTPPHTNIPLQQQQQSAYTASYTNVPLQQQQQQPGYFPPYTNNPPQQHQPTPQTPLGYNLSYTPPSPFNNVAGNTLVGNNIVVNHSPSLSLSQNLTALDIDQQNAQHQLGLEIASGQMGATEEEEEEEEEEVSRDATEEE